MKERLSFALKLQLGLLPVDIGVGFLSYEIQNNLHSLETFLAWTIVISSLVIASRTLDKFTTIKATEVFNHIDPTVQNKNLVEGNILYSERPDRKQLLRGRGLLIDSLAVVLGTSIPIFGAVLAADSFIVSGLNHLSTESVKEKYGAK